MRLRPETGPLAPGMRDRLRDRLLRAATARDRALDHLGVRRHVVPGWLGEIDPIDRTTARVVLITGWALFEGRAPDRVRVTVDDRPIGLARIGMPRPGAALRHRGRESAICGFEIPVFLPDGGREYRIAFEVFVGNHRTGFELRVRGQGVRASLPLSPPRIERRVKSDRSRPLRVLALTHSLLPGGAQIYFAELLRELRALNCAVDLIAPSAASRLAESLRAAGVSVSGIGEFPFSNIDAYERVAARIESLMRVHEPDVVLLNSLGAFIGADVASRLSVPAVWAIHEGLDLPLYLRVAFGTGLHAEIGARVEASLSGVDLAVFESDDTRKLFEPRLGARARWMRYGVDVNAIQRYCAAVDRRDARRRIGLPEYGTILLCAATVEPRKNQVALIRAFEAAAADDDDVHLVFLGERPGLYATALAGLRDSSPARERVHVAPIADDPFPFFRASDVLVSTGDVESMPRCLLEAFAFGLPVIATDVAGTAETVEDSRNGILCAASDVPSLAASLRRMLDLGAAERQRLGETGRATVLGRHDSKTYARDFLKVLEEVADTAPR